jgi:hypothetical protein
LQIDAALTLAEAGGGFSNYFWPARGKKIAMESAKKITA